MKERSLVIFTLLSQLAIGTVWWSSVLKGLNVITLWLVTAIMLLALGVSLLHLGSPLRAWHAIRNVRSSWLSREVLCAALFTALLGGLTFAAGLQLELRAGVWLVCLCGLAFLISMTQAYRLRTVPEWDRWATTVSFFITTLLLGAVACGVIVNGGPWLAAGAIGLLGAQQIIGWSVRQRSAPHTDRRQQLRVVLYGLAIGALVIALLIPALWLVAFLSVISAEALTRVLFYEKKKPLSAWRWAASSTSLRSD